MMAAMMSNNTEALEDSPLMNFLLIFLKIGFCSHEICPCEVADSYDRLGRYRNAPDHMQDVNSRALNIIVSS
jgi:hypothetical protein